MGRLRLILNGKSTALPLVREAVERLRGNGRRLEVRVTWEGGDARRLAREACAEGVDLVVAGGGDGTLHEVVNGLTDADGHARSAMAMLPLGTANDFARACGVPLELDAALDLAVGRSPTPVDLIRADGELILNAATAGFGAEVTVATPAELKRALGGLAYTLVGLANAFRFKPFNGRVRGPHGQEVASALVAAVANGRQAGGGQQLAPRARIDDGLLDVITVHDFPAQDLPSLIDEVMTLPEQGRYVSYRQLQWIEIDLDQELAINFDGEPRRVRRARFEVLAGALPLVVPPDCPLLSDRPRT